LYIILIFKHDTNQCGLRSFYNILTKLTVKYKSFISRVQLMLFTIINQLAISLSV